jgi:two-component system sensor histidine kinase KdpD
MLSNNLALAQQLGATVFTYRGDDVVKTILQFAKEYLVGHIVIGAPGERPTFWRRMTGKRSISERLIAEGLGITVVVVDTRIVPGDLGPSSPAPPPELAGDVLAAADEAPPKEASLLADGRAFIWHEPLEKEAAMKLLLDACCPTGAAVRDRVWAAVVEREKQGSTFVGEDVALPHARIEETAVPRVALGVGKSGIRDPETGLSARIMIMLLSPAGEPDSHVRMLGAIGRLACDDQWRREVLAAANPSEVVQITNTWGGLS